MPYFLEEIDYSRKNQSLSVGRVRSWSHWNPTSGFLKRQHLTHQALQFNLTQCCGGQHSMSGDFPQIQLQLHPPLLDTLLLPGHPQRLLFFFPQPWTCPLHLQRQYLLRKSVILHLSWWLCCENVTDTQIKMSQELGYPDRFERNTSAYAWEYVSCHYVLMDMIYFRKKKQTSKN